MYTQLYVYIDIVAYTYATLHSNIKMGISPKLGTFLWGKVTQLLLASTGAGWYSNIQATKQNPGNHRKKRWFEPCRFEEFPAVWL